MESEFTLIDFDGVITNTFQLCLDIVTKALPDETEQTLKQRFATTDSYNIPRLVESANMDFFQEYTDRILDQPLTNGITDVLEFINANFTTILVSSTTSPPIKKYLQHHNLAGYFSAMFCNDVPTSKADKFKIILQHFKTKPSECVFITDTAGDIQQAHLVNIPSIGVTWGYHDETTLQSANPATTVDYPTQLKGAIEETLDFSGEYDEVH